MYQGGNQVFASPEEALTHVSETPWSNWTKADYTLEQWHAACLVHIHDGEPTSKSQCKLPVKTPDGSLNRNGVHAAAAALAGARGGLKGVSDEEKKKAANALRRYYSQLDEDPPESLAHHGVKGMRWGIQKKEETSPRETAARNESEKRQRAAELAVGKPNLKLAPKQSSQISGKIDPTLPPQEQDGKRKGLTRNQKIALGIGAASVAGFIAYNVYLKKGTGFNVSSLGPRKPANPEILLKGLGRDNPAFQLKRPGDLVVDLSKGYADIRPKTGFANEMVARHHAELIDAFEDMRKRYPSVRDLAVEVVPMSQVPGMDGLLAGKSPAAVMAVKKGEARLMYNDLFDGYSPSEAEYVKRLQPGIFTKKFLGYHEMGHMLAVAHGEIPDAWDMMSGSGSGSSITAQVRSQLKWSKSKHNAHKAILKKHGLSFKELSKLSPYGATEPAEALAELSGHYFTPEMRSKLTPKQLTAAKALFDEMGGVR